MITPSFNLTATERVLPKLALDFTTAALDSRITFTRTTGASNPATYTDSNGYVTTATNNQPRFDYDPTTLACKGLLIEESRANLVTYSQELVTGWTAFATTRTASAATSPDGTNNAVKLASNIATSSAHQNYQIGKTITNGAAYTASCYMKAAECSIGIINHYDTGAGNIRTYFNLANGTVGTVGAGVTASIVPAGDGWYRCIATRTVASTSGGVSIEFSNADNVNTTIIAIGSGIYAWGAQLEAGAFATSYIPTEASALTRNADVATITGTSFSDWYVAGSGALAALVLPSTVSGTRPAIQFDDNTADEIISLRGDTTNPELVIVDGGSPQAQIDAGTIAANTAYNLGAAWATDDCAAAVNGGAAVTDTTATIPTVTQARLGSDGTNYLNGHLQTLRYWPQRLINAEVQAFSK
jgi:hypothetical protein